MASLIMLGMPVSCVAEELSAEAQFMEELPVVLTLSRLPQTLRDAPGAVTVIDADIIRRTGYRDLGSLLKLVPGMQVAQERGGRLLISYHGLTGEYPNQMQVLLDGRSVYSPFFYGGADWTALPVALEDIERIEIVRGSDSAAYGSNAYLGVVNIITRHSSISPKGWITTKLGSGEIVDVEAGGSLRRPDFSLRGDFHSRSDAGFDSVRDSRRQIFANLRADLRVHRDHEFTLFVGGADSFRGLGYASSRFNESGERNATNDDIYAHLRWRYAPDERREWLINAYRNRERGTDEWIASGAAGGITYVVPVNQNRISIRDNLDLQHRVEFSGGSRLVVGGEWRRDRLDSKAFFFDGKEHSERINRFFGNLALRLDEHWLVNLGCMAEDYAGDAVRLAPRIFANWQPDHYQTWRGGVSRAWRQPTLFERYGDVRVVDPGSNRILQHRWIPNPNLRPQRIDTVELGYFLSTPANTFQLDIRFFSELVGDYVIRASQPRPPTDPLFWPMLGTSRAENYDKAIRLQGLEYELRWQPWPDGKLLFSHSINDRKIDERTYRASVAPYTASLTWFQDYAAGWQSTVSIFRMASFRSEVGYDPGWSRTVAAYTSLDARIARRVRFAGREVEVALAGTNLLGRHLEVRPLGLGAGATADPPNQVTPRVYLSLRSDF